MRCPKCGSQLAKKVHVLRHDWAVGLFECFDCMYKGQREEFVEVMPEAPTGVRPKSLFDPYELVTKTAVGEK